MKKIAFKSPMLWVLASIMSLSGPVLASDLGLSQNRGKDISYVYSPNDIVNSNNQIGVEFVTTHFAYKEYGSATQGELDSEGGWVPGVGVNFSIMRNWFISNFYFNAQLSWENGQTDYIGQSLYSGGHAYGSVRTKSGADVQDYDFRLGKGFLATSNLMLTPYFGFGWHDWDRKINSGEDYSDGYYGAGLLVQYAPIKRLVLSAHGLIGKSLDSHIVVNPIPDGPSGFSGGLGNSTMYRGGFAGDYALTRNIHLNASVEWIDFRYGASADYGGYYEPDSRTSNVTAKVGAGYAFGNSYEPLK